MAEGTWFKSSYSASAACCVEVCFTKSSSSNGQCACVEVGVTEHAVLVRDSKYRGDPELQPVLSFTAEEWTAFLAGVVAGEFSLP